MIIRVFVSYILFMLIAVSCNVSNQESVDTRTSASISDQTFSYSTAANVLIANTTSASITPLLTTPATYSISPNLPSGLSMAPGSGIITGTPLNAQSQTLYIVTAKTSSGNEYAQITIEITDEPVKTLSYSQSNLVFTKNTAGTSYTATTTGGTPTSFTIDSTLPNGLSLSATTGTISGTPTVAGSAFYEITAKNAGGEVTIKILVDVKDAAPAGLTYTPNSATLDVGDTLTPMVASLTSTPDSVTYSVNPSLPAGLSINSTNGTISGAPTETHNYGVAQNYTITATNESGSSTATIALTIDNPPTLLDYNISSTLKWEQNNAISPIYIYKYEGGASRTFSCTGCPAGITVHATSGIISGTPTAITAPTTFTIVATIGADTVNSTPISYEIVQEYPDNYNNLGYASTYTLYTGNASAISITPATLAGGNATKYKLVDQSYGQSAAGPPEIWNTPITNMTLNYGPGASAGELYVAAAGLSGATDVTFVIEGYNLDSDNATYVKTGEQQIRIKVEVLPPTGLGYNTNSTGTGAVPNHTSYNSTSQVLEFTNGITITSLNPANGSPTGGTPDTWTIVPQLPDGLSLAPTTGIISGKPTKSTPITYYTITGTNDGGSYSETIAIRTDIRIGPQSLVYANSNPTTHYGDLTFTIFTFHTEAPTYEGSSGSWSISPALPDGLAIDPGTGLIYGTPYATVSATTTYNVTVTNSYGSLTRNIQLQINNNNAPQNLVYKNGDGTSAPIILYEGDTVTSSTITHSSDYDPSDPNSTGGYIESYTEVAPATELGVLGLTLNSTTGDITGTAVASASREQLPATILAAENNNISITGTNDQGSTTAQFTLAVYEKKPVISYDLGYGTNVVLVKGDNRGASDTYAKFINVTNTGGLIASTYGGAAVLGSTGGVQGCTVADAANDNYPIDEEYRDYYADDVNNDNNGAATTYAAAKFSFEPTNCSFRFNANTCFSQSLGGLGGETTTYTVSARNSGSEAAGSAVSVNLTVHKYDGPNYVFEPEGNGLTSTSVMYGKHHLTLDGFDAQSLAGEDSFTPYTTNMCHDGSFNLTNIADLPPEISFAAGGDGTFSVNSQVLMGRSNFVISSSKTPPGTNITLTQTENITVQASHLENNAGSASHLVEVKKIDVNADGYTDVIMRSKECDPVACTTNNVSIYIQNSAKVGFFDGVDNAAAAVAGNTGLKFLTGITYGSGKGGILAVSSNRQSFYAYSATSTTELLASTSANTGNTIGTNLYGIVPMETGVVNDFGVFSFNGTNVVVHQFSILAEALTAANAASGSATTGITPNQTTATVTLADSGAGSINPDAITPTTAIKMITHFDMDANGYNEAVIVYDEDNTAGGEIICIVPSDGTTFSTTCSAKYAMAASETIKKVIITDITGDTLPDMAVLTHNPTTDENTVYIYENKSAVTIPGDFNTVDLLNLGTTLPAAVDASYVNFDIADVNNDGLKDIIANDRIGDLDGDGTNDSSSLSVSGYTIYNHTNTSDIYQDSSTIGSDDDAFFYHNSYGNTYDVELLDSAGSKVLMNCSIQTAALANTTAGKTIPTQTVTGCGIIGAF